MPSIPRVRPDLLAIAATAIAIVALAPSARAVGAVNLSWSDCGTAGMYQRNFACNTNEGSQVLVASGVTEQPLSQVTGMVAGIYVSTNRPTVSSWWTLGTGGCRSGAAIPDFDFRSMSSCLDPWAGNATGSVLFFADAPERLRIAVSCSIPAPITLPATGEYYFCKLTILNTRTSGSGACGGCTDGACLVLGAIQVTQATPTYPTPYMDHVLDRSWVIWQPAGASMGCPYSTPVRATSWGAVKSMYR